MITFKSPLDISKLPTIDNPVHSIIKELVEQLSIWSSNDCYIETIASQFLPPNDLGGMLPDIPLWLDPHPEIAPQDSTTQPRRHFPTPP